MVLAEWQTARLLEAYTAGSEAQTTSQSLVVAIGPELLRRAEAGLFSDDDWRLALRLATAIYCRPRWLAGEPLVLWIRELDWLRPTRIRARAIDPSLGEVVGDNLVPSNCGNCRSAQLHRQRALGLLAIPAGTKSVLLEVEIELGTTMGQRLAGASSTPRVLWLGAYDLAVEAVDEMQSALPAASGAALDAAVRNASMVRWVPIPGDSGLVAQLRMEVDPDKQPDLARIAISAELVVRHDGQAVELAHVLAAKRDSLFAARKAPFQGSAHLPSLMSVLGQPGVDRNGWTVVLRGTSKDVLPIWEADRWWSGEVEIPLAELVDRARARGYEW